MRWVMGYATALCILVLIISQSVIIPTFFMPFYDWHYSRPVVTYEGMLGGMTIPESLGMTHDDLMDVTRGLLDYMIGRRDSLEGITAHAEDLRIYGEDFFTQREIDHMIDVRMLFDILFIVRNVAFFLLVALILGMILLKLNPLFLMARCSREVMVGFLIITVIMAILISIDFERSWDLFHYIFFFFDYEMLWRLTPYRDLMINMVPLHFFLHISIFVGVLLVVASAVVIVISTMYLRLKKAEFERL
ncbi:MAG: TIGR01906 family membrane protein [Defluviitaleaceae bacterium]|nr:TIGR01906 family membrane protein [Defluviitaleaceae bacterium]